MSPGGSVRYLIVGLLALVLAGCVTVSNTLRPEQVSSFKLVGVDVVIPQGASIRWGDGEVAYAATKGLPPQESDKVSNTPEAAAYIRNGVSSRVRAAFQKELGGRLVGTRPIKIRVTVRHVEIASVLRRIVVGGHHTMSGDVAVIDAKTGAVLSDYPAQTSMSGAGQGIGGTLLDAAFLSAPIDRVVTGYAEQYGNWLIRP